MKSFIVILGVVILILAIILIFSYSVSPGLDSKNEEVVEQMPDNQSGEIVDADIPTVHTITYDESGYSPATLSIKTGDTVTFQNVGGTEVWTASAMHPTHTVYPGSNINKCVTAEALTIFDQCNAEGLGQYSFTFLEVGEWGYHNHVRASHFGKILVSE